MFEEPSKRLVGLERLMLEASGFDFRNRYPQQTAVRIAKQCGFDRREANTAFYICTDIYRTHAPLKQTTHTMAMASAELAARLYDMDLDRLRPMLLDEAAYKWWGISRAEVMGKYQSFRPIFLLVLISHRDASRPNGSLHTSPRRNNHRTKVPHRHLHLTSYNAQQGSHSI